MENAENISHNLIGKINKKQFQPHIQWVGVCIMLNSSMSIFTFCVILIRPSKYLRRRNIKKTESKINN